MSRHGLKVCLVLCLLLSGLLISCNGKRPDVTAVADTTIVAAGEHAGESEAEDQAAINEGHELTLPVVKPVGLQGGKLRIVATTSIIGDVVAQVGGETIELTTLMGPGQDPHSYEPGARELTAVADAHVIFINGWDLEEALVQDLENIGQDVPIVPVSAHISPLVWDKPEDSANESGHSGVDPHVWLSVQNVAQWVKNIAQILQDLDPDNGQIYADNAAAYLAQLAELETYIDAQLKTIPAANRFLVTNHDAFAYFAQAYNFEIVGTIIPGISTMAEPSANDLTTLIATMEKRHICTIFTETAVSDQLAQVVTEELNFCDRVQMTPLSTGSLGPAGSDTDGYLGLMRTNVDAIVAGIQ